MVESGTPVSPRPGRVAVAGALGEAAVTVVLAATLTMALVLAIDVAVGGQMASMSPAAWGYQWAMHVLSAVLLGGLAVAVARVGRWRRNAAAVLAAGFAAVPAYLMGTTLASGAWIAEQRWAWAVRIGPAVCVALGIALLVRVTLAFPAGGERRRTVALVTAATAASAVVFASADALVMAGLHPTFHLFVHAAAALFVLVTLRRLPWPRRGLGRARWLLAPPSALAIVAAIAALFAVPTATTRGQLLMRSPIAGAALRTFTLTQSANLGDALGAGTHRGLHATNLPRDLIATGRDWNVVWVVVDTLRADALPPVRRPGLRFASEKDTPFLNEWIASSFRFERAYAQAAATHWSIPAMFHSVEGFEEPSAMGIPIPTYMSELGRRSFAVVNHMFIEPHANAAHRAGDRLLRLTNSFEELAVYDEDQNSDLLPLFEQELEQAGREPFFAWVHFFNMHDPGYDGKPLSRADGRWTVRYKRSLGWLDGQMRELIATLERHGVADRTIVILSSDHGEHLGQHGTQNHGSLLFEEAIHVPLAIRVPGVEGRSVAAVVSNVDILPTIADLLGAPIEPVHRGYSLVPLMTGALDDWDRTVYATNWDGESAAIVHAHDKLIYDAKARLFLRFDLAADPREQDNVFDDRGERERDLKARLLDMNPSIFEEDLRRPEKQTEILTRLTQLDPRRSTDGLAQLLRVLAVAATPAMLDQAERIFVDAADERTRAEILRALYATDQKRWRKRYQARLSEVGGGPAELEFVDALAALGQPAISPRTTARRMEYWATNGDPVTWWGWLQLTQRWKQREVSAFRAPLVTMLAAVPSAAGADENVRRAILLALATLEWGKPDPELAAMVVPLTTAGDDLERRYAVQLLGAVGSREHLELLDRLRSDPVLRVRVAALDATIRIDPAGAEPRLLAHADDDEMVFVLVPRLAKHGSAASIPFLERSLDYPRSWVRGQAQRALAAVKARQQGPSPSPPPDGRTPL